MRIMIAGLAAVAAFAFTVPASAQEAPPPKQGTTAYCKTLKTPTARSACLKRVQAQSKAQPAAKTKAKATAKTKPTPKAAPAPKAETTAAAPPAAGPASAPMPQSTVAVPPLPHKTI
ncbi:MAG TPA: hypothetical protein VEC14_09565 [Reyranellaceae bacterium]|nr:hypothetical protein [Reyranellaceae bacterium]